MPAAQSVVFHEPKHGSAAVEWEDGAGYVDPVPPTGIGRYVVVDGATEAFDSIGWASLLVDGFLRLGGPPAPVILSRAAMDAWVGQLQEEWSATERAFSNVFEERKFLEDGSFATFLGCVIALEGNTARWSAAAVGDTVLFHVRGTRLLRTFPDDTTFGINPEGMFTQPSQRARTVTAFDFADGELAVGDRLFLATDAFAEWMVRWAGTDPGWLWTTLSRLDHHTGFRRFVAERRAHDGMKNDDATLLRIEITAAAPAVLVVNR